MYTDIVSFQIVISLLKKYNIKNIVLSAGNRHTPFARSVENDGFFTCYSVVDERSAGFFAIGLINELNEPVVIACTSGTSVSNYVSAFSEAYYNNLPLIAVTADRNGYYLYQQEEQCVPQAHIFDGICKKSVTLPFVKDKKDFWYCSRLVNEALLELDHRGKGPVHINVPVEEGLFAFNTEQLPEVTKINRIELLQEDLWRQKAEELSKAGRILITYGQSNPADQETILNIEKIANHYNAIVMVEHLSNLNCYGCINAYNVVRYKWLTVNNKLTPDIVIAVNGNVVEIRSWLTASQKNFDFWNVREDGKVSDPFRRLTNLFECDAKTFFAKIAEFAPKEKVGNEYLAAWQDVCNSFVMPQIDYSDLYSVRELFKNIPENAILNLANSNSVRLPQHFNIKKTVKIMCNRGVNGIDGSLSSFVGQSCVHNGLSFLLIGDLSFFYDMNGIWNQYVSSNMRIMLNNNGCGEIFYGNKNQDIKTVGRHIAADHNTSAKAWVEERGFKYLKSTTKEEFDEKLKEFLSEEGDKPIFFEVFTDKYVNIAQLENISKANVEKTLKSALKSTIKTMLGK